MNCFHGVYMHVHLILTRFLFNPGIGTDTSTAISASLVFNAVLPTQSRFPSDDWIKTSAAAALIFWAVSQAEQSWSSSVAALDLQRRTSWKTSKGPVWRENRIQNTTTTSCYSGVRLHQSTNKCTHLFVAVSSETCVAPGSLMVWITYVPRIHVCQGDTQRQSVLFTLYITKCSKFLNSNVVMKEPHSAVQEPVWTGAAPRGDWSDTSSWGPCTPSPDGGLLGHSSFRKYIFWIHIHNISWPVCHSGCLSWPFLFFSWQIKAIFVFVTFPVSTITICRTWEDLQVIPQDLTMITFALV